MTEEALTKTDEGRVTLEAVRRIAELSSLRLTAEEEPRMVRDLNAILGYVDALKALDTTDVEPMAQGVEPGLADALRSAEKISALRPDERRDSLDRAAVMREAPETDGVFFKVPKVIER